MRKTDLEVGKNSYRTYRLHTLIIGSGAASLKAADRLHQYGITDTAIVTDNLHGGTSRNTGSDKQTYYKPSLSSPGPDSPYGMADALVRGGGMHGDIALTEALGSLEAFYHLVTIGVPFPHNEYGG
jgi:succinate dehydrogenase/fumarate reductase flavoprotein subunit